jgi:hypothetical protein
MLIDEFSKMSSHSDEAGQPAIGTDLIVDAEREFVDPVLQPASEVVGAFSTSSKESLLKIFRRAYTEARQRQRLARAGIVTPPAIETPPEKALTSPAQKVGTDASLAGEGL